MRMIFSPLAAAAMLAQYAPIRTHRPDPNYSKLYRGTSATSKYMPHQSDREKARRVRAIARATGAS